MSGDGLCSLLRTAVVAGEDGEVVCCYLVHAVAKSCHGVEALVGILWPAMVAGGGGRLLRLTLPWYLGGDFFRCCW